VYNPIHPVGLSSYGLPKGIPERRRLHNAVDDLLPIAEIRNTWILKIDQKFSGRSVYELGRQEDVGAGRSMDTTQHITNRIHICLVTSPAGRPLYSFKSSRELLEATRDAIAAHRSLLEDGKMLHRDISENNILITTTTGEGGSKGRLINMDLGKATAWSLQLDRT
jgi:hypothetical protein